MDNLLKSFILTPFNILYKISPKLELELLFRLKCGYKLNLDDPQTYNEKIQWIKLNDKNPLMTQCSDKYAVRSYVKSKGCGDILNTLLWEGFEPEKIPFDTLPEQCVIKVTHGSTFNIICQNTKLLDHKDTIKKCNKWLKAKFLPCYGEWFYGKERPRVIVEKYLDGGEEGLKDYKVYCFNGEPRYVSVDSGRSSENHVKNIYDTDWNLQKGYEMAYPCSGVAEPKPEQLDELLSFARILSEDFLHSRVDFYIVDGKVVFGEISFTNSAGFGRVEPRDFALKMGGYLKLPQNISENKKIV